MENVTFFAEIAQEVKLGTKLCYFLFHKIVRNNENNLFFTRIIMSVEGDSYQSKGNAIMYQWTNLLALTFSISIKT